MFVIDDWLAASSSVVSMVPPIIAVAKELQGVDKDPSAQMVITELIAKTKENCEQMLYEVESIEEELKTILGNEKLEQPLADIYDNLKWYAQPVVKYKLSNRLTKVANIRQEMIKSSDNLAAVIICNGKIDAVTGAYRESRGVRHNLSDMSVRDTPFLEQTKTFKQYLENYIQNLSPQHR